MAVSHSEFWQRYFYKVHRLEQVGQEVDVSPGGWVIQPRSSLVQPREAEDTSAGETGIWAALSVSLSLTLECLGEERTGDLSRC